MNTYIAIIGSRDFDNLFLVRETVDAYVKEQNLTIAGVVSGGARGADSLAEDYAREKKLKTIIHYPEWDTYGKKAGYIRNKLIIDDSDVVFAFWDGVSKGTASSIKLAVQAGKPLVIIRY